MNKKIIEIINGICLFGRFKKSSSDKSSSKTTSNSNTLQVGGNFTHLILKNDGSNYLLQGFYTVRNPVSQLAILGGVTNETTGNNIHSVFLGKLFEAELGLTLNLNFPVSKEVNNYQYLVLIVVTDSDENLSWETLVNYNVAETVFVPIEGIR